MEKPTGHGDFANLIRSMWPAGHALRLIAEELEQLERQPGFARLMALLDARERMLTDRLVVDKPGDVRSTDQIIGTLYGLRQVRHAVDSIIYEAHESRERDEQAAAEADAKGATA